MIFHSSLSTLIWYCSPDERCFTLTSPFSHSELPTNINLRAFIRDARLNTLPKEEVTTYQKIFESLCGTYINAVSIMYHLSGLFSNTKSTLWPFPLRIVATPAAAPWRSGSRAHTIFSTCWPTSGISPFSFSSWALIKRGRLETTVKPNKIVFKNFKMEGKLEERVKHRHCKKQNPLTNYVVDS